LQENNRNGTAIVGDVCQLKSLLGVHKLQAIRRLVTIARELVIIITVCDLLYYFLITDGRIVTRMSAFATTLGTAPLGI